ncbi:fimbrial protein [Serratia marcescens]|uniref:fimbrial protein n=1 Tax=Serratia marcescens TaxID=615 RepID=UPI0002B86723|nr:fimbrial protein [Serratia marcescens]EMF07318.1 minor component of type 1 fimbriae [Serratia marcescens VGH107]
MSLKIILKRKGKLIIFHLMLFYSLSAKAFTCKDSSGNVLRGWNNGDSNYSKVYVNLTPAISKGGPLIADLSQSISCKNDRPASRNDFIEIIYGTTYSGALSNFYGQVDYYGSRYDIPINGSTQSVNITSGNYTPWNVKLYLTPVSTAGAKRITQGEKIATLKMYQRGEDIVPGTDVGVVKTQFTWDIYAYNEVIIPTGTCEVVSRQLNIPVMLPDYPGTKAVELAIHCAEDQELVYTLSGSTVDKEHTIFTNTSSLSPASGIGVQLSNRDGAIPTNKRIPLGTVGTSPVSLGLTASYAQTDGQVVAGNVQTVIEVRFDYP